MLLTRWHSREGFSPFDCGDSLETLSPLLVVLLAAFSFSFALLSFFHEIYSGREELIENELRSGLLGLRCATLIFAIKSILSACRFIESKEFSAGRFNYKRLRCPEVVPLSERITSQVFSRMVCTQYIFYTGSISTLWYFFYLGISNDSIALLHWSFFFIADDWVIMSEYAEVFKGRILGCHSYKITLFNILISFFMFSIVYGVWGFWAILILALMLYYTCYIYSKLSDMQIDDL
ncbi:hypothetical protein KKHLCK_05180 [Candidatus Electrothrix laxa]